MRLLGQPIVNFAPDGAGSGAASTPAGGGGGETPAAAPSSTPSGASSDSAGTPAPASGDGGVSPSPPTPSPTPIPSSFEGLDFSEVDDDSDFGIEPAPVAPVEPAVAAPVVPPAATPPAQPAVAAAPTAAPAPATGPQGEAAIPSPAEPAKIAAAMLQNEQAFVDHLAANEFAMSAEDLAALDTDAPAHIPKLLARVYLKAQTAALNQMQRVVPAIIQAQAKIMARNTANEGKFYARWPEISKDQHGERVAQLARTYRQMNPATSLDQMIEDLGPIVMMTAKIAPGQARPAAPAAPGQRLAPRPAPSPFRPAGTSASGGAAPQPGPENPWLGLSGAHDEEE